jgi:hypothetical protein
MGPVKLRQGTNKTTKKGNWQDTNKITVAPGFTSFCFFRNYQKGFMI